MFNWMSKYELWVKVDSFKQEVNVYIDEFELYFFCSQIVNSKTDIEILFAGKSTTLLNGKYDKSKAIYTLNTSKFKYYGMAKGLNSKKKAFTGKVFACFRDTFKDRIKEVKNINKFPNKMNAKQTLAKMYKNSENTGKIDAFLDCFPNKDNQSLFSDFKPWIKEFQELKKTIEDFVDKYFGTQIQKTFYYELT